jgi:hypothetical protein
MLHPWVMALLTTIIPSGVILLWEGKRKRKILTILREHISFPNDGDRRLVHLAYQSPANGTFLSEQTSHQQAASNTFLSEQTGTSHQPPAKRTGCVQRFSKCDVLFFLKKIETVCNNAAGHCPILGSVAAND